MSSSDAAAPAAHASEFSYRLEASGAAAIPQPKDVSAFDELKPEIARGREHFIPVTRFALLDRLTSPTAWPNGEGRNARRFFRYLDHWRRQQYTAHRTSWRRRTSPSAPTAIC